MVRSVRGTGRYCATNNLAIPERGAVSDRYSGFSWLKSGRMTDVLPAKFTNTPYFATQTNWPYGCWQW